jgi:hypothetical protein
VDGDNTIIPTGAMNIDQKKEETSKIQRKGEMTSEVGTENPTYFMKCRRRRRRRRRRLAIYSIRG